jgi:hypothetical protein
MRTLQVIAFVTVVFLSTACSAQQAAGTNLEGKPEIIVATLKDMSDNGLCDKVKLQFTVTGSTTIKLSIREDSAGIPGRWYTGKSNPRANDADYKGLKEYIDYDFQVEAINANGSTLSPILTRKKCR